MSSRGLGPRRVVGNGLTSSRAGGPAVPDLTGVTARCASRSGQGVPAAPAGFVRATRPADQLSGSYPGRPFLPWGGRRGMRPSPRRTLPQRAVRPPEAGRERADPPIRTSRSEAPARPRRLSGAPTRRERQGEHSPRGRGGTSISCFSCQGTESARFRKPSGCASIFQRPHLRHPRACPGDPGVSVSEPP